MEGTNKSSSSPQAAYQQNHTASPVPDQQLPQLPPLSWPTDIVMTELPGLPMRSWFDNIPLRETYNPPDTAGAVQTLHATMAKLVIMGDLAQNVQESCSKVLQPAYQKLKLVKLENFINMEQTPRSTVMCCSRPSTRFRAYQCFL